jgi:hypothetical protein
MTSRSRKNWILIGAAIAGVGIGAASFLNRSVAESQSAGIPLPCKQALAQHSDPQLKELSQSLPDCSEVRKTFTDALIEAVLTRRILGFYHGYDSMKEFGKWETNSQFWLLDDTMAPVCNPRCGDGVVLPEISRAKDESGGDFGLKSYPFPGFVRAPSDEALIAAKTCQIVTRSNYTQEDYNGIYDEPDRCSAHEENWVTIPGTEVAQAKRNAGGGEESCEKYLKLNETVSLSPYYAGVVVQATWAALSQVVTKVIEDPKKITVTHPVCQPLADLYFQDLTNGTNSVLRSLPDRAARTRILGQALHSASRADLSREAAALQASSGDGADIVSQLLPKVEAWLAGMGGASLVDVASCEIHQAAAEAVKVFSKNVVTNFGASSVPDTEITLHRAMMFLRDRALVWCTHLPAEMCWEGDSASECRTDVRGEFGQSGTILGDFDQCFQWHFTSDLLAVYEKMDAHPDSGFINKFSNSNSPRIAYNGARGSIGANGCIYSRTSDGSSR